MHYIWSVLKYFNHYYIKFWKVFEHNIQEIKEVIQLDMGIWYIYHIIQEAE